MPAVTPRRSTPPTAALLAVLALAVAACSVVPVIGERSWSAGTTNQLGQTETVTVTDTSGLVREVAFDPADADVFGGPVTAAPGVENALDITWTAAACDVLTDVDVAKSGVGLAVTVTTTMDAAGCDAFGVPRAVRLLLVQPIGPAAVTVTQATE